MNLLSTPAALIIFLLTIGISLYTLFRDQQLLYKLMLRPYSFWNEKQYYQIITSGFLHADLMHLLFNMFTFYFFAFYLESALGTLIFLIIYVASLILSSVSTIIKKKNDYSYASLGASGAISGVVFAYALINPTSSLYIMPIPFPIPAYIYGVLYLVWSYYASKKSHDMINHEAHFWGAITGIIIVIILVPSVIQNFINQVF